MEPLYTVYEEMYTHESFLKDTAPGMAEEKASVFVKLNPKGEDVYERLMAISEKVGGDGATYKTQHNTSLDMILLVVGFLLLIIFCGYLIIYNIFYISVVNDIRFLGMMKTIGTTGRQVKKILSWQVRRLAVAGIGLGVLSGYLVSLFAAPAVMSQTSYADFYEAPKNPWGLVAAVLFAALTVLISCRKSYGMASKISPVEAARYRGSGKSRRKLWSVLSFAIGGLIFLIVYTATIGYDVEKMVECHELADVTVEQLALANGSDEEYNPISGEMVDELQTLPFVESVRLFYSALDEEGIPCLLYTSRCV